jgi:hypothetical protein
MKLWTTLAAATALVNSAAISQSADLDLREGVYTRPAVVLAEPCGRPAYRPLGFRAFAGTLTYVPGFSYRYRRYCRTTVVHGTNGRHFVRHCL